MLTQFTKKIEKFQPIAMKYEFCNFRLFQPVMDDETDKLHFLVDVDEAIKRRYPELHNKAKLQQELREMLHCDVIVLIESHFEDENKAKIIGETVKVSASNIIKIIEILIKQLTVLQNISEEKLLTSDFEEKRPLNVSVVLEPSLRHVAEAHLPDIQRELVKSITICYGEEAEENNRMRASLITISP